MTDDIDTATEQKRPISSRFCPTCGMFMNGFVTCPWCTGRKTASKPKSAKKRRWFGTAEITNLY